MNKLGIFDWLALVLLIVGGLNWGLVGIFDIDLVEVIFGDMTVWARIIYAAVGLSAVYVFLGIGKLRKE